MQQHLKLYFRLLLTQIAIRQANVKLAVVVN